MKHHHSAAFIIGASIVTVTVLASISATPIAGAATVSNSSSPTPASGQDAAYSTTALTALNALEATIAATGACNLPTPTLSRILSGLIASPTTSGIGLGATSTRICADIDAVADPRVSSSALTSTWAWGNPVADADDARGLGEPEFAPATLAAFTASRHLTNVRLSVPWAADQGAAIRGWLGGTVSRIHANGETVFALGGDTAWVADPSLVSQWITAAHSAAPFDGIQLDVEPWTSDAAWATDPTAIARYIAMVKRAESTAHSFGMTFNLDAPWWLSTTRYLSGSVLGAVLPFVDSVSIVAFSDHAGGTDGIIAQAWPAVIQVTAALVPFTVGVQTSSDAVSGGAQYTFADKGSAALEVESAKVRSAYTSNVGYSGIAVEEYLSWVALKR